MTKEIDFVRAEKIAKTKKTVFKTIVYILLSLWAIMVLFPFYWMLLTSVKGYGEYNSEVVPKFFAIPPTFENYVTAFTSVPLIDYFFNTIVFFNR